MKDVIRFGRVVALELRLLFCRQPKLVRATQIVLRVAAFFALGVCVRQMMA